MIVMVVLVALLGIAVVALSYRLWKLRQGGTAAIMRDIPAVGGHGWRHGVIRYRGGMPRSTDCPVFAYGRIVDSTDAVLRSFRDVRHAVTSSTS